MAFNIANFKSELNKNGMARTSYYEVMVNGPTDDLSQPSNQSSMTMRAEAVSFPGRTLTTSESKVYGPARQIPVDSSYEPVTITFLLSENYRESEYFQKWHDKIVGNYRRVNGLDKNMYDLQYYDSCVGRITYKMYNELGKETLTRTLEEVYPSTIGAIEMSYITNEPARIQITFNYHRVSTGELTSEQIREAELTPEQRQRNLNNNLLNNSIG